MPECGWRGESELNLTWFSIATPRAFAAVVVRDVLVERDGIERIADVDPAPHVRRDDEVLRAGEIADVVLHLGDAER